MTMSLNWEEITTGQVKAVSREPIAIYEISEVPISKQQSRFRIQITTETGAFTLPRDYRTMSAAQRACNGHLNNWRREIAENFEGTTTSDWRLTKAQARELADEFIVAMLAAGSEAFPEDEWLAAKLRERGCPEDQLETWRERIKSLPLDEDDDGGD
jgi:hypothetical protein